MPPHADRLSMATSAGGGGDSSVVADDSISESYLGAVSLPEPAVPADFAPSLAPTVDPEMLVDANGRKKRLWLLTVTPGTSTSDLEGAKLKKSKCTGSTGTQFRVNTRVKKDHVAVVMNRSLESAAVRMRIAGSVTLTKQFDVPGIQFDPTKEKIFSTTRDAHQRYVPFGAADPLVYSRPADELPCSPAKKRKKKKSKTK